MANIIKMLITHSFITEDGVGADSFQLEDIEVPTKSTEEITKYISKRFIESLKNFSYGDC